MNPYKIITQYYGSQTRTFWADTLTEGQELIRELCLDRNVRGVPFLTPATKTDLDMGNRK